MRRRLIATALAAAAALPAAAPAQSEQISTAANPAIAIGIERATSNRDPIALRGERFRVRVSLSPYIPGQTVTMRIQRGDSKLRVKRLALIRRPESSVGQAVIGYTPRRGGRIRVRASHVGTPDLATAVAPERLVRVVAPSARSGQRGPAVRALQRLLAQHGYVTGERGVLDARTARAVLAFRKVSGLPRTADADRAVFRRLARGGGTFAIRYPRHGRHVEADLTHQVIALIDDGRIERIYPTSSGSPVTPTVLGNFRLYRKDPGTNALGMVFASYFTGGYAIHGYSQVPVFPASHGCLRVPVPDAVSIFEWLRRGDRVDVYYRGPAPAGHSKRIANPGP